MAETMIYYADGSERRGPYSLEQFRALNLSRDTLVWYKGLSAWTPAWSAPLTAGFYEDSTRMQGPEPAAYQQPYYSEERQPREAPFKKPSNYLVWAIIVTVACCFPFGIPAIVCAARVNALWTSGQFEAAVSASKRARMWIIISAIVGFVCIALYLTLCIIAANESSSYYFDDYDYYDYDYWDY